jgi:hypothetical protein
VAFRQLLVESGHREIDRKLKRWTPIRRRIQQVDSHRFKFVDQKPEDPIPLIVRVPAQVGAQEVPDDAPTARDADIGSCA